MSAAVTGQVRTRDLKAQAPGARDHLCEVVLYSHHNYKRLRLESGRAIFQAFVYNNNHRESLIAMKTLQHLIAMTLLTLTGNALASTQGTEALSHCMDSSAGIISALVSCLARVTEYEGARLDRALNNVALNLGAETREKLIESQRTWLRERASVCNLSSAASNSFNSLIDRQQCLLHETAARADKIEALLN
jgi:uncharacterized protein YecT (DUF1311 family)